jgi:hypothetical protein
LIVPVEHHVEWIAGCIACSASVSVFVPCLGFRLCVEDRVEVADTGSSGSVLSAKFQNAIPASHQKQTIRTARTGASLPGSDRAQ